MATFNGIVLGPGSLNLRATPSTGGTSRGLIPEGTSLSVSTFTGTGSTEWFSTSYGTQSGYVMAKFIKISTGGQDGQVTTASGSLNIRVAPQSSASILYTAPQYSTLRVLDTTSVSGWYRVCGNGGTGWAVSSFITLGGTTLQYGSSGPEVTALHNRLLALDFYINDVYAYFGFTTEWAVKYFQSRNGLHVTGVVDSATQAMLNTPYPNGGVDGYIIDRYAEEDIQPWFMNDALWANVAFNANDTPGITETIGDSGNAPTSFAMIASTFNREAIMPPVVCKWAKESGYRDESGNTGVTSAFFNDAASEYGLTYGQTTSSLSTIRSHCANGGLALIRVVGSSLHGYCSLTGATYLAIYKIDDNTVYVNNPNLNTQWVGNLSLSAWTTGGWSREAHLYTKTGYPEG